MTQAFPSIDRNLYDILAERGLVAQCTDEAIRDRFSRPVTAYIGFDPTADSLHIGSLVPIMGLAWIQRCGHKPVVLVGGGTGLVGDPSGKTAARRVLTREQVAHNLEGIRNQIARVVHFDTPGESTPTGAQAVNNADWLCELNWIDMLREVGSVLSVNRMLSMESVKGRMQSEGEGITFLEFNYMVMQAYDFLYLHRKLGVTVQLGGQDQWGNIVMGIELGRRLADTSFAGLTFPLVTKSDGSKFGKSEAGNIWLDAARTAPYDFYQFWRNTADADVRRFLAFFTFLPIDQIDQLCAGEGQALNPAKEVLAHQVTTMIHGQEEAEKARDAAQRAFGAAQDVTGEAIPSAPLSAEALAEGPGLPALLVQAGLASSNGEARRLIQGGGVRVGERKIDDPAYRLSSADVTDGYLLLRAGKKRIFRFDLPQA